ncbi:uncharacterized protein LOC133845568 [Drosophila sulfurigaster albostrigata]|uniref:uncharacterized protein LOC133845568 n=1 Tax=Drosophila sulfurigaster albostrigata TaxID=89887 RepID=UPI002D21B09B|nr:uncharacterized protein LOC133845568 [Drosophila sulfurigaster albostrigata]
MLGKCTFLAIWLLLCCFVSLNSGQIDCSKRLDYGSVAKCCSRPNFKFDAFQESCAKFIPNGIPRMSPCTHECIYNAAKVLNGTELNVENTTKMLNSLFSNTSQDHITAYVQSMKNCSDNAERLMKRMKKKVFGQESCSMLPIFINVCSGHNLFAHCPEDSWHSSKVCEEGRDFILNCKCDKNKSVCVQF